METRVLLIEDDSTIVENLSAFLKEEGFLVTAVNGQAKALQKLEEERPQMVLLDVTLAEGNGYSTCTAIKMKYDIPCCRDVYYAAYRRFFWLLSKRRD